MRAPIVALSALILAQGAPVLAQQSVGRGAPIVDTSPRAVGAGGPSGEYDIAARNGASPRGIQPLARDRTR
jgi:hypothetical protein